MCLLRGFFGDGFLSKNCDSWNFSQVNLDVDSCGSKAQRPDDPGLWPCQHGTSIGYRFPGSSLEGLFGGRLAQFGKWMER